MQMRTWRMTALHNCSLRSIECKERGEGGSSQGPPWRIAGHEPALDMEWFRYKRWWYALDLHRKRLFCPETEPRDQTHAVEEVTTRCYQLGS